MRQILSLGAGIQSTALLLLSEEGILPRLDLCIFADTGWEPESVYRHLNHLERTCHTPIVRVETSNIRRDALTAQIRGTAAKGSRWASMPYFVKNEDGSIGKINRQCTDEYKIRPIERYVREQVLCLKPRQRWPKKEILVQQWFGITLDEIHRLRTSRRECIQRVYPFVGIPEDMMAKRWTRADCVQWLNSHAPGYAVSRSACIGCPFHSNKEWRELQTNSPAEFADAVEFDRAIRHCGGMRGQVFLHRSGRPLDQIDFRDAAEAGDQLSFAEECEGLCGL